MRSWKQAGVGMSCAATLFMAGAQVPNGPPPLQAAQSFDAIADPTARSQALFVEAGKVLLSPRCQNCHPNGDRPTQNDDMHLHLPVVVRGPETMGAAALRCMTCHQGSNFEPTGVPGHPKWQLAPLSMAWQGKTLGQICRQLKDPTRNGGRDLAQIQEHMAHDDLVGWGWHPGGQRTPAPGTQADFGQLIAAWIASGAACPAS